MYLKVVLFSMYDQVFRIAYCIPFQEADEAQCQEVCQQFLLTVRECQPELLQKRKVHLLLHLVECMREYGPTASFNTERWVVVCNPVF